MSLHKKKFTFEDPEDSYWNESGSANSSSLFDDLPSKQWAARAAVDNLFDTRDDAARFSAPSKSPPISSNGDNGVKLTSAPTIVREKIVDEFISNRIQQKDETASPRRAPSIISECSASSLPSEAQRLDLDYNRLRAEHRKLQRHLETIRHERFRALDVKEAARRLLRGDPVSLDFYRSREEKEQLLEAAIDVVDSNVILTVLLFVKNTLIDSIFREILMKYPEAAEEYITYLKTIKDYDELTTVLFGLGRITEATMMEFSAATKNKLEEQKLQAVRRCGFNSVDVQLGSDGNSLINDYVALLERQIAIENSDSRTPKSIPNFTLYPKKAPLPGCSSIATLYYVCLYHFDAPLNALANPSVIKEALKLSEKEFAWTCISALARQHRWPDIERVLTTRSAIKIPIRGGTKLACPFSWQNLFWILFGDEMEPPKDLLTRILQNVSDNELRLKLAEEYRVYDTVIECLVAQKDRLKLAKFCAGLKPHTPESYKALAALNNGGTKWKN